MTSKKSDRVILELTKEEADDLQDALWAVANTAVDCLPDDEMPFVNIVEWFEGKLGDARDRVGGRTIDETQ